MGEFLMQFSFWPFLAAILLFLCIILLIRLFQCRKREARKGMERFVGRSGMAAGKVTQHAGYVQIGTERCPARTETAIAIADGTPIEVVGFEGRKLKVKPIPQRGGATS